MTDTNDPVLALATEGVRLRTFLAMKAMEDTGCDLWTALEAVSSTAMEYPDWNLEERRPYSDWLEVHP